jgi:hypothetical protein
LLSNAQLAHTLMGCIHVTKLMTLAGAMDAAVAARLRCAAGGAGSPLGEPVYQLSHFVFPPPFLCVYLLAIIRGARADSRLYDAAAGAALSATVQRLPKMMAAVPHTAVVPIAAALSSSVRAPWH